MMRSVPTLFEPFGIIFGSPDSHQTGCTTPACDQRQWNRESRVQGCCRGMSGPSRPLRRIEMTKQFVEGDGL